MNLFISLLENLSEFLNLFFNSLSIMFEWSLLPDKHLYFIEISLKLSYSRKQSKSLHLILWIPSVRLPTRFDKRNDASVEMV